MKLLVFIFTTLLLGCASTPAGVVGSQIVGVGVESYKEAHEKIHHGIDKPIYKRQCAGLRGIEAEKCSDRVRRERRNK